MNFARNLTHLILIQLVSISFSVKAELGGQRSAVGSNQKVQTQVRTTVTANYRVESIPGAMFTTNEYIDNSGFVFAVTWRGAGRPDLESLLGSYYREFNDIDSARPMMDARQPVNIETQNIIVIKDGHPRDFRGIAYMQGRLPSGFNLGSLK